MYIVIDWSLFRKNTEIVVWHIQPKDTIYAMNNKEVFKDILNNLIAV